MLEHPYTESGDEHEVPLYGGNVATVVRMGDTVRRSAGPWTPAVHALLHHLETEGFEGAPRALGVDAGGREVLTFLDGDVFQYPMPDFVWSEETLVAVAALLRRYHDAVRTFIPPPDAAWQVQVGAPSEGPVICHNDIAPYNTVFSNGMPVGFIDWDLAAPGPALYDIAYAVWFYVPLYQDPEIPPGDGPRRLRLFCDAYGLPRDERLRLLPLVRRREEVVYRTIVQWGEAGKPGWADMLRTGHAQGKLQDINWLDEHREALARELER